MPMTHRGKRTLRICLTLLAVLLVAVGVLAWYKLFRVLPQEDFVLNDPDMKFKYGSLGAEGDRGLPYWIWAVLPRIFPEMMPGPGGYKSFGVAWEEGQETPVGFAKKTVGFPRITNNCAICHVSTWREKEDATPHVVVAGPSNTHNLQAMLRFLSKAGNDPRFNADTIMTEIAQVYDDSYGNGGLSWLDRMIYRYVLIPATRNGLREQERLFAWMNREGKPNWGPGRDDPMNLTKYFMTQLPEDTTVSQTDFPSIWNLGVRSGQRNGNQLLLNWSGDTPAVRSVIIDSALGLGAPPEHWALERMAELDTYLSQMKPPPWPKEFPAPKPELVAAGKPIYDAQCARCHEPGAEYTNLVIKIEEVGTDIERMKTWNKQAAEEANRRVKQMGINRPPMTELDPYGYVSPPLDGLWLRAPYLHNGSVPNLRELLEPVEKRSKIFYFGYDVYDPVNVGFVTSGAEAERVGFKHDASLRGESNIGHLYGTDLPPEQKEALLEYMKTL